jgi:hypothetical protein
LSNKLSSIVKDNKANVITILLCLIVSGGSAAGLWTPQEAQQGVSQAADVLQTQIDLLAQNQTLLSATVLALTQNSTVYGEFIDLLVENQTALQNWLTYNVNPSFYRPATLHPYCLCPAGSSQTVVCGSDCSTGLCYVVAGAVVTRFRPAGSGHSGGERYWNCDESGAVYISSGKNYIDGGELTFHLGGDCCHCWQGRFS